MKEFVILQRFSCSSLCEEVNKYLNKGFELHGFVFTYCQNDSIVFCQALIKK